MQTLDLKARLAEHMYSGSQTINPQCQNLQLNHHQSQACAVERGA